MRLIDGRKYVRSWFLKQQEIESGENYYVGQSIGARKLYAWKFREKWQGFEHVRPDLLEKQGSTRKNFKLPRDYEGVMHMQMGMQLQRITHGKTLALSHGTFVCFRVSLKAARKCMDVGTSNPRCYKRHIHSGMVDEIFFTRFLT